MDYSLHFSASQTVPCRGIKRVLVILGSSSLGTGKLMDQPAPIWANKTPLQSILTGEAIIEVGFVESEIVAYTLHENPEKTSTIPIPIPIEIETKRMHGEKITGRDLPGW